MKRGWRISTNNEILSRITPITITKQSCDVSYRKILVNTVRTPQNFVSLSNIINATESSAIVAKRSESTLSRSLSLDYSSLAQLFSVT